MDPKPGSSPFSEDPDGKSAQRVVWKTLFSGGYQVCEYSAGKAPFLWIDPLSACLPACLFISWLSVIVKA